MGVLVGFVGILLIQIFWGGYVAATLWGWFMVPLGVVAITYWHAVGLGSLLSVYLGSRGTSSNSDESLGEVLLKGLLLSVIIPLVSLGLGWLAKINM